MIRSWVFSRAEFGEATSGQVRLSSSLARSLTQAALPRFEREARSAVKDVIDILVSSSAEGIRGKRRTPVATSSANPGRIVKLAACEICGSPPAAGSRRKICDECSPRYQAEKAMRLSDAGRAALARVRESDEPSAVVARRSRR